MTILDYDFYQNSNPFEIGEQLLGKIIQTKINDQVTSGRIVELEIYKAPEDRGSHAYLNKRTKRTETIFQDGGIAYVYLCYGIHHMFNVVSGPKDVAHAMLIRAIEPVEGIDIMFRRRRISNLRDISNGPGKLCQALGIKTNMDGTLLTDQGGFINIFNDGYNYKASNLVKGPRVGIAYAKEDALLPYRYYLKQNHYVSRPLVVKY
jgi:DNA-3-methyladenine glycosylase